MLVLQVLLWFNIMLAIQTVKLHQQELGANAQLTHWFVPYLGLS